MLNFKKNIGVLLLILSISCFTHALAPREVIVLTAADKYQQQSKYKNRETDSQWIHSGSSMKYGSSSIGSVIDVGATSEIHNIDIDAFLHQKFSEKEQKETLKKLDHFSAQKIVREQDVRNPEQMSEKELLNTVFDSDIVLQNIYASENINRILKHPLVTARFDRLERYFKHKKTKAWTSKKKKKYDNALKIIKIIRSKEVEQLIDEIHHADFDTANRARKELAQKFLQDGLCICDNAYPIKLLGIDLFGIITDDFVTRRDYLTRLLGNDSLTEIEQFSQLCDSLQYKNDVAALASLYQRLSHKVAMNKTRNIRDEICSAIVERAFRDPINLIIGQIRFGSWDESCAALNELEQQGGSAEHPGIIPGHLYMRQSLMHKSKYYRLATAQKFQKARSDYALHSHNESNANSQVDARSEGSPYALEVQEQLIDVPPVMSKCEENSVQQTCLEESSLKTAFFIPVDVQNITIDILNNSSDYGAVAYGLEDVAKQILGNAYLCNVEHVADIHESIDKSLYVIRAPKNDVEFVFHVATVDHVLTDLQTQSEIVVEGKPVLWERAPDLLVRAVTTFVLRVNPVEQLSDWGLLAQTGVNLVGQGAYALADAAVHPVTTAEKMYHATEKACEFVVNVARFTAESVNDAYHLTPEERLQRMNSYWENAQAIYKDIEPHLTAENFVDVTATVAADIVAGKGFCCLYRYAKDLHVLGKMHKHVTKMAKSFKHAVDTHLADNPVVITAEGIVLKMSDGMKDFNKVPREIINSTKTLLESVYAPIAESLKAEIDLLKKIELPYGFAEFSHRRIKIAYEHILGVEIGLSKKGKVSLGGFHHDYQNTIEKSKVIEFANKIINNHGCYKADLIADGSRIPGKTFFPSHWSRKDTANKIHEAYDDFIKSGAIIKTEKGGKYVINGLTSEGIAIEMYVTKSGEILTAYPLL